MQVVPAGSTGLVLSADISGYVPGSVVYYHLRASNLYGSANGATYGAVMPTAPRPILSSGSPGHTVSPEDRGSALLCEVHAHGAGGVGVARSDTLRIPARP